MRHLFLLAFGWAVSACAEGTTIETGLGGSSAIAAGQTGSTVQTTYAAQTAGNAATSKVSHSASTTAGPASSSGTGNLGSQNCADGMFASGMDEAGQLICTTLDAASGVAINDGCSVFLGARDGCEGCGEPPSKWGHAGGPTCTVGPGANNTCSTAVLGGSPISLFGLDLDGGVDANDKLYAGFNCAPLEPTMGPCAERTLLTGFSLDQQPVCIATASYAVDFVRDHCKIFFGWRDNCDGCAVPPAKWGSTSAASCDPGSGPGNSCTGSGGVQWMGVDLDGDVNDDDKLYMGMSCAVPPPATSVSAGNCPAGQVVTGIDNGVLSCESPGPTLAAYLANRCTLYLGWTDNCNGCTAPPQKWGAMRTGYCANGGGGDNTCSSAMLGADTVSLFGLSFDGDVNDDDKLHVGFKCE